MDPFLSVLQGSLEAVYPREDVEAIVAEVAAYQRDPVKQVHTSTFSQHDAVLVAYADSVLDSERKRSPLASLDQVLSRETWSDRFPVVHLLPFFPWDTDRGFSVMDFRQVAPENGDWEDVHRLGRRVRLMFDFVANHASIENPIIQGALIARHSDEAKHQQYQDFVVAFSKEASPTEEEIAAVARPRAAPLLTEYYVYRKNDGSLHAALGEAPSDRDVIGSGLVWTTFSRGRDDQGQEQTRQVDLNYRNPKVFLEALRIVLFYAQQRASWIRLDAIGYLWKELGTSSLHARETHKLIAAFHAALAYCAPELVTVAEVNEPQEMVFSYLGEQTAPEADLVYQFTHYPLAVYSLFSGSASAYRRWLSSTEEADGRQFVMILGSHDGMGLKPLRGCISEAEIERFAEYLVSDREGRANYARLPGGKQIIYEVCGTAWSLINAGREESFEQKLARFRLVTALGLFTRGIPAFYIQGVLGAENYYPDGGLDENRTLNRERFALQTLQSSLEEKHSQAAQVSEMILELLRIRGDSDCFNARRSRLEVLDVEDDRVVMVRRRKGDEELLLCANVSEQHLEVALPQQETRVCIDLLSGLRCVSEATMLRVPLPAFGVRWLRAVSD